MPAATRARAPGFPGVGKWSMPRLMDVLADWFIRFMPLIKIGAAFVFMLVGIRLRLGLGLSILLGSVILGLLFGMGPLDIAGAAGTAVVRQKALFLGLIVALILVLSDVLERTGQTVRLMDSLGRRLTNPRLRIIFFPALIGLLPMPGGAIFSAPLVKTATEPFQVPERQRALLNYWFRHIWEMAWPLYPGILLTASLSGLSLGTIISHTFPGVLAAIVLGWFFFLRPGVLPLKTEPVIEDGPKPGLGRILLDGLPFVVAIGGAIGLEVVQTAVLPHAPFEIGVCVALLAAVLTAMAQNRVPAKMVLSILGRKGLYSMLLVVAAVFVFQEALIRSGAIEDLSRLAGGSAALVATAVILPLVAGLVSGISIAFVGASFPLLLGLLAQLGMSDQMLPYMVLGLFTGFAGVMASPLHICFILTCQYFHVDLGRTWRSVALPSLILLLIGVGWFLILQEIL